jgi:hypothetical protein
MQPFGGRLLLTSVQRSARARFFLASGRRCFAARRSASIPSSSIWLLV